MAEAAEATVKRPRGRPRKAAGDAPDAAAAPTSPASTDGEEMVPVAAIVLDSDVQPRESISTSLIKEYAEAMEEGAKFPAVKLFRDKDGKLIAADGWHRIMAAKQAGQGSVLAEIRDGDKRDAILFSVGANATHGLRRTDADKRRAVLRLLHDPEWNGWSASVIAQHVGVSQPFVSGLRRQLEEETTEVRTSDGRTMSTGNLGGRGGRRT